MVGEIERVLEVLNLAGVRYLVVGGVAVVIHGHLRTTADLDLVVQLERENVLRAIRALSSLGYRARVPEPAESLADPTTRERWIRDKGLTVFSLWSPEHPSLEVDLFVSEPFNFEETYGRALRVRLERVEATIIGLEDLIALKTRAGRPLDADDIAALDSIRRGPVPDRDPTGERDPADE